MQVYLNSLLYAFMPKGKRPLGRPRLRGMIILLWIFRKWNVVAWAGSSWLRIGSGGGDF
jgi:hypothetical protein